MSSRASGKPFVLLGLLVAMGVFAGRAQMLREEERQSPRRVVLEASNCLDRRDGDCLMTLAYPSRAAREIETWRALSTVMEKRMAGFEPVEPLRITASSTLMVGAERTYRHADGREIVFPIVAIRTGGEPVLTTTLPFLAVAVAMTSHKGGPVDSVASRNAILEVKKDFERLGVRSLWMEDERPPRAVTWDELAARYARTAKR